MLETVSPVRRGSIYHCSRCGEYKPREKFYLTPRGNKANGHCKPCQTEHSRWRNHNVPGAKETRKAWLEKNRHRLNCRRYGITVEQYRELLDQQGGGCAICATRELERGAFDIDHNHVTGKVRGLLCNNCNTGLGKFKDNPVNLGIAISYLGKVS